MRGVTIIRAPRGLKEVSRNSPLRCVFLFSKTATQFLRSLYQMVFWTVEAARLCLQYRRTLTGCWSHPVFYRLRESLKRVVGITCLILYTAYMHPCGLIVLYCKAEALCVSVISFISSNSMRIKNCSEESKAFGNKDIHCLEQSWRSLV